MGFQFFKESYTGKIKEITLGKGKKTVTVGGENCYPFYQFEGTAPNPPQHWVQPFSQSHSSSLPCIHSMIFPKLSGDSSMFFRLSSPISSSSLRSLYINIL